MHNVSKTQLTALLLALVTTATTLVVVLAFPSAAYAQEGIGEADIIRFRRRVQARPPVEVVLHRAPKATGWSLRLVDRSTSKTITLNEFPEWAGADYYGYDVLVSDQGRSTVVVFEASPAPGVEAPPSAESWQVAWAYGKNSLDKSARWRLLAETKTTPLDGGDRLVLREVDGATRLVRLKTSDRTSFCGAQLGSFEVFDDRKIAFRTRLALDPLLVDAVEAKASLPNEPFAPSPYLNFYGWFSASSDRRNQDDARSAPRPIELGDRDVKTAWTEGAPGLGRGEFVTARISPALKLRALRVFPGDGRSEEEFEAFSRPKTLLISLSEGRRYKVDLPDVPFRTLEARGGFIVDLPEAVRTNCLSVAILEAREGRRKSLGEEAWKRDYTAISEITPVSELHGLPPEVAALVTVEMLLKEDDPRRARRLSTLVSPLGDELVKQLRRVLQTGREEDRVRVVPLLRGLPSEEAVSILVTLFESVKETDRSYPLVKRSLVPHGEGAAEGLMNLHRGKQIENVRKQIDLVRLVGRLGTTEHRRELSRELGEGSSRLRNERARAVARGGDALLPTLFETIASEPDSARGYDALRVITSVGRQKFYRGQGTATGSKSLLRALDNSESRRSQLLILRALGMYETEGAVPRLVKVINEAKDPLGREEAVEAVGRYEGREARRAVEKALGDQSPDVRLSAISAIRQREDSAASLPEVRVYVDRETWNQGLADGFTLLAESGDKSVIEFLERSIARDPTSERAVLITESLERAEQPISDGLLFQILDDEDANFLIVKHSIDLLGLADSEASLERLSNIARKGSSREIFDDRRNESLRTRALLALGRRRTTAAADVLLDVVKENADEHVRRTALRGLSFMADRNLIRKLQLLQRSTPDSLEDAFDDTVKSIDRRASVNEVESEIGELSDEVDQRAEDAERDKEDEKGDEDEK